MSGHLKSTPSQHQAPPAVLSLSGMMAVSQILKLDYYIYKPVGNNSVVKNTCSGCLGM